VKTDGEILREIAEQTGLTQHELAEKLGVKPRTFDRYLADTNVRGTPGRVMRAAEAFLVRHQAAKKGSKKQ
jgi:transcriptional regulator with XRE-family HTH domain